MPGRHTGNRRRPGLANRAHASRAWWPWPRQHIYWAAWMDALPVIRSRFPEAAAHSLTALEAGGGTIPCLREAAAARTLLIDEGWDQCPKWRVAYDGARPPRPSDAGPGDWPHGWQHHETWTRNLHYRECVLLPALPPASKALLRSQGGARTGMWLAAIPSEPALTLVDPTGHATCTETPPATALAAVLEPLRPWTRLRSAGRPIWGPRPRVPTDGPIGQARPLGLAREAVGADGQVVPQQWLAHTNAPGVPAGDRRWLDVVVYGAAPRGGALCCDATLVSPLTRAAWRGRNRWGRPASGRTPQAGCLPGARPRGPPAVGGAWVGGWGPLERRCPTLRPGAAPRASAARATRPPISSERRLVAPPVGHSRSCRAARGHKHSPWLCVAGPASTQARPWSGCWSSRPQLARACYPSAPERCVSFAHMCDTPPDYSPGDTTPLAPTASRPPIPSPETVCSSPVEVAPTTPPWLLGPDTPVPPACPSANACPVCICDVHASGQGPETPFAWPNCQHRLHLGCLAHLTANVHPLRCPACRADWPAQAAQAFVDACRANGVALPSPAPGHDTTSASHRETLAPHPPQHLLPLCCPRVYLADPARAESPEAWRELPDRHMHWAPVHRRQDNAWTPEWTCLRCNTCVDGSHPLLQDIPDRPVCPAHGPRLLALEMREGSRGRVCARGSPPQMLPCAPARIALPAQERPSPDPATSNQPWYTRGPPPAGQAAGPTHSWLLVPLLHAAVGRLHPQVNNNGPAMPHLGTFGRAALRASARPVRCRRTDPRDAHVVTTSGIRRRSPGACAGSTVAPQPCGRR